MTPTLVACSHGTSDPAGRAAVAAQIDLIRRHLPGTTVTPAFVDVEEPAVDDVVSRYAADGPVVVVPLLLSTGFHTGVDIARAVAAHPGRAVATAALGPHPLLADVLHDRLAEAGITFGYGADVLHDQFAEVGAGVRAGAGARAGVGVDASVASDVGPGDAIVLAAAGSSDPAAADDVRAMAALLAERLGRPVEIGFAAGAGPRIAATVQAARDAGHARVVIASYVLAPGHFARVIASAGGDLATAPLAPDARIAEIAAQRFRAAAALLP